MDLCAMRPRSVAGGACCRSTGSLWGLTKKEATPTGVSTGPIPLWRKERRVSGYRLLKVSAIRKKRNSGSNNPSTPEGGESEESNSAFDKRKGFQSTTPDWRTFRAALVAQEKVTTGDFDPPVDQASHKPSAKLGSKWAHPIAVPETGCILVATEKLDGVRSFERSVVLLLRSGTEEGEGPFGVIINRPLNKKIKDMKPGNTHLASTFANCRLHFGGPLDASMFLLRSDVCPPLPGFEQVLPGICFGARNSLTEAAELVRDGALRSRDFRFFLGYAGWQPEQLLEEIESGFWVVAACSADLIGCAPPSSSGLWEEVLQLMGGWYSELSRKPKDDDY